MAATSVFEELEAHVFDRTTAVCLGTGRFLRAVLVPALVSAGEEVVLAQTRGASFGDYMATRRPCRTYEVDTVMHDGGVDTDEILIAAVGSLGNPDGCQAFMELPQKLPNLRYVGVGITEAGICHNGKSIQHLAAFLHACFQAGLKSSPDTYLSVLNTDNMPQNGTTISKFVIDCDFTQGVSDSRSFTSWLRRHVVFHNTMVDRITSHREGAPEVPRAEPLPKKALVVEDLKLALPQAFCAAPGVVVRTSPGELSCDLALKLRVANGTHTAMVYSMALGSLWRTDGCMSNPSVLPYLEQLYRQDILQSAEELQAPVELFEAVFQEWMLRLQHPHFSLETFFICQNASQKLALRLLPSVQACLRSFENGNLRSPSAFMAFAFASALRFVTPLGEQPRLSENPPVFAGQLDDEILTAPAEGVTPAWEYVPGLQVCPELGTYEFRDGEGQIPSLLRQVGKLGDDSVTEAEDLVWKVMTIVASLAPEGAHEALTRQPEYRSFSNVVAAMLQEMLGGKPAMVLLAELCKQQMAT
mmetsp:Transcript_49655/g.118249  ORF Transcript_49655/g.118249 Transcript_49655/m.118249 type:complete len:529 (-) Transcript_49655:131-1717(-)|eukprot:CAMPEP_0178426200 /NCGR_PEP_ID=MMETSP0689_2-20121128/29115_1 /TAXON_ID=160604 /ORGANISM="Amphidinium massartii, Strain CS-259" /LENGTH=528 /DNA_ID=CAMNT_0020047885 /DNA_START=9 /DNA_END=1595 /DNA_ORIENTATION=-